MENSIIIKEHYGKSSDADFIAKGRCKALFRGQEHFDEHFLHSFKSSLSKKKIRVFDINLYDQIEIKDTLLLEDWVYELNNLKDLTQFTVQFKKEAAIYFSKLEWENVDFIRTEIEEGILINPKIVYAYQEDGFTFGEIEGDLLFKVHNPKPVIKPEVIEIAKVVTPKTIIRATFKPLLPSGIATSDIPMMLNADCFWSFFRFLILLLLAFLLIRSCSEFSTKTWNKERDDKIKKDSTLQIPDGDEKEFKDGRKNYVIDLDTTLIVPPGSYKLFIKDNGTKVDHDKINIFLNGKIYKRSMEIYRKPTEIPLTNLKYGENYIDFAVISQGNLGNCTAKILMMNSDDSNFATEIEINNVVNHISRLKIIQR